VVQEIPSIAVSTESYKEKADLHRPAFFLCVWAVYISVAAEQGGRMRIPELLMNLEFVGRAEGDKRTYYVFKGRSQYLVASANRDGFNLNVVDGESPEVILKRKAKRWSSRLPPAKSAALQEGMHG
jgi:hypothetical protein